MVLLDRIKATAKYRKLSIAELEKKSNLGTNYIYSLKEKTPSAETLLKIADALNVSMDYLMERTDNIEVNKSDVPVTYFADDNLTEADKEEIRAYIEFKKIQHQKEG